MADREEASSTAADDDSPADADAMADADAAGPARPAVELVDDRRGDAILRASWIGTAAFTIVAVASLFAVRAFQIPMLIVSLGLFAVGLLAFVASYLIAIARSREVEIGMGGLYFLAGTAPRRVRRNLLGSFALEVIVATVTASIGVALVPEDANNPLAFGFLVPLYGMGMAGLWGARYGAFAPRRAEAR